LQRRLLAATAPLVAPGGVLVYSVCTLTSAETGEIDQWSAAELPEERGWSATDAPGPPWSPLGRGARLLPQSAGTDGMYLLAWRRRP
ncbi:MAG: hypothetical protein ACRDZX_00440, partial [Acidimicrobiales bacterium]